MREALNAIGWSGLSPDEQFAATAGAIAGLGMWATFVSLLPRRPPRRRKRKAKRA
jgi:hypothetical protein